MMEKALAIKQSAINTAIPHSKGADFAMFRIWRPNLIAKIPSRKVGEYHWMHGAIGQCLSEPRSCSIGYLSDNNDDRINPIPHRHLQCSQVSWLRSEDIAQAGHFCYSRS